MITLKKQNTLGLDDSDYIGYEMYDDDEYEGMAYYCISANSYFCEEIGYEVEHANSLVELKRELNN